jgi:hypothetical protein
MKSHQMHRLIKEKRTSSHLRGKNKTHVMPVLLLILGRLWINIATLYLRRQIFTTLTLLSSLPNIYSRAPHLGNIMPIFKSPEPLDLLDNDF